MTRYVLLLLASAGISSAATVNVYDSAGFESPRFLLSQNLDGEDALLGPWQQDGGNSTATIDGSNPIEGAQSVKVTRAGNSTGNTRWGVVKPFTPDIATNKVEILFDMRVTYATIGYGPLFGVEAYDTSAGTPKLIGSLLLDASTGDVLYQEGGTGLYRATGVYLRRNVHHHCKLVLDFTAKTYSLYADGHLLRAEGFVDTNAVAFTDAPLVTLAAANPVESGTAYFDNYAINLQTAETDYLLWRGDGASNVWDVGVSSNWFNGLGLVAFTNGAAVVFDDTGSNAPPVTLQGTLGPASITVNATQNYTFAGTGEIAGGTLAKLGTGMLRVNGLASTGAVLVAAGTFAGSGSLNGPVTILPGSALSPEHTLTINNSLTLTNGVVLQYGLGTNSDHLAVTGHLRLSGALDITDSGGFGPGTYTLISYSGTLSNRGVHVASAPAGYNYAIATNTPGQINLIVTVPPTPPDAPSGLSATAVATNRIDLAWTDNSTNETSFLIERSFNNFSFTQIAATGPNATSYADTNLFAGTTYYYRVRATNGGGNSAYTEVASATTLGDRLLWAYWKFDETAGTTAADSVGPNDGALAAGASWVAGKINNAIHLNGTSSGYVSFPAGLVSGLSNITIATWVRLDANTTWNRIFDFGSGTSTYMFLSPASAGNTVRFAITTGGSAGEEQINSAGLLSTGVWHHLSVTLSNSVGILYINGVEAGRNETMTLKPSDLGSTTQNWLGRSQWAADPYLGGSVDDFRIYNRSLSAAEVSALVNPPTPPAAPTGLTATPGNNQITLNWTGAAGAASYNVKRATVSGGPYTTIDAGVATTSYPDLSVTNGVTYYYVVSAVNAHGESPDSAEASATVAAGSGAAAHYEFEGDAHDSTGNGYDGTAVAVTYTNGKVGTLAAQFNGAASFVSVPRMIGTNFTVAMWLKTTDTGGTGSAWYAGKGLVDGRTTSLIGSATLQSAADASIQESAPTVARGTNTLLAMSSGTAQNVAYIRFDLSAFGAIAPGAALTVYNTTDSMPWSSTQVEVYGLRNTTGNTPQNWDENALTYSSVGAEIPGDSNPATQDLDLSRLIFLGNLPALLSTAASVPVTFASANLDAFLTERIADGGLATILLVNRSGSARNLIFHSKETGNGTTYTGPSLAVTGIAAPANDWGSAVLDSKFVLGIGNPDTTISSTAAINDGAWHHVAATRSSDDGMIKLYVDGVLNTNAVGPTGPRAAPATLRIGAVQDGSGFLDGVLDDVRLYERVLTDSEIAALATPPPAAPSGLSATAVSTSQINLTWTDNSSNEDNFLIERSADNMTFSQIAVVGPNVTSYSDTGLVESATYYYRVRASNSGGPSPYSNTANATTLASTAMPVAWYRFELNTLDSSGRNNHGAPVGGVLYGEPKEGANSAQYDGTTSFVEIPASIRTNFTAAMWVKTTNTGSGANWYNGMGLVDGEMVGSTADWGCSVLNSKFAFGVGAPDATFVTTVNINDGSWHHLAATRESSTGAIKLYVDGVLNVATNGATGPRTAPNELRIGATHSAVPTVLRGNLDDVRLYDRVLTADEITALASPPPPLTPFEQWQFQYFGCTNCPQAAGNADADGDGMNNDAEFAAGTDPTNSVSALRILFVRLQGDDLVVTWRTVGGKTNALQATAGDANGGYTTNFTDISGALIIAGSGDTTTNCVDAGGATNAPARFYRVRLVP
jgi:hypothetical protein